MAAHPTRRVVAIHQPNYLPWLGYFHKMFRCDVFVFLDDVQMSRQSYTQRVQVLQGMEPRWLTVPILHSGHFGQSIKDTRCDPRVPWARKHAATLQASYGRHPCFATVFPDVGEQLSRNPENLADVNVGLIERLAARLAAPCAFVRSSTLGVVVEDPTDRLVALVQSLGGTSYLHGGGGTKYQDAERFTAAGIELVAQGFRPEPYPQRGPAQFVGGLSVVDALFNLGYDAVRELLAAPGA